MSEVKNGSCLCGKITYKIDGPMSEVTSCHCTQCRKQTGHHYSASKVSNDDIEIKDDDNLLSWYRASDFAARGFCSNCGSALFWQRNDAGHISLMVGTIDGDTNLKFGQHIFTADKGDYYQLDKNERQFTEDYSG